ncbi:hypothetical protein ACHQM5_013198 [Ranunculus cassubicifolius]
MTRKRKSETSAFNEIDRTIYSSFRTAASALSQLYSQPINQHKLAFQAGERHALEKLHEWMTTKEREGTGATAADVCAYLQSQCPGIETVSGSGSQIDQNEKKSPSSNSEEHSEQHQKAGSNSVSPVESDMDIS